MNAGQWTNSRRPAEVPGLWSAKWIGEPWRVFEYPSGRPSVAVSEFRVHIRHVIFISAVVLARGNQHRVLHRVQHDWRVTRPVSSADVNIALCLA